MSSKNGFDHATGPCRVTLNFEGIYPDPFMKHEVLYRVKFTIVFLIIFFYCNVTQTIKLLEVFGDLGEMIEVLTTMDMPIFVALTKIVILRYKGYVLRPIVSTMMNDWASLKTKEELEIMWKNAKQSRLLSFVLIGLAESVCVMYIWSVVGIARMDKKQWDSLEHNETDVYERALFFQATFFYDVQKSPQFEITWLLQCASMFLSGSANSSIDSFFACLVLHLCSRLSILRNNLKKLSMSMKSEWDGDSYNKILSNIIEDHVFLENHAKTIEDTFNFMFLGQMLVCTIVICIQGYGIVTVVKTAENGFPIIELCYLLYFVGSFSFAIYVYCYVAERLREECEEIGNTVYELDWYTFPSKNSLPLTMIMFRAKYPFVLTAGKFVEFSMEVFATVLKTSGGYLSMLLAVSDRKD